MNIIDQKYSKVISEPFITREKFYKLLQTIKLLATELENTITIIQL